MQSMTGKVKSVHVNFRIHAYKPGVGDVIYFPFSDTEPYPMSGPIIKLVPSKKNQSYCFYHCKLFSFPKWSRVVLLHGNTQKVPCRQRCLPGIIFIHSLVKWEQPKGALQRRFTTGEIPYYYYY